MEHSIVLAELDKQIDLLSNEVCSQELLNFDTFQKTPSKYELYQGTVEERQFSQNVFSQGPDLSFDVDLKSSSKHEHGESLLEDRKRPQEIFSQGPDLSFDLKSSKVSSKSELNDNGTREEGKINDINGMQRNLIVGILCALENCQLKIQELEKEKSESKTQIKSLEQELNSARQLLFLKSGTSPGPASPDPLYKSQSLEKLQKLKSNWIQDARNEVEELRKKVEIEKRRQSQRQSKGYLYDDTINSTNDESINEESVNMNNDVREGRGETRSYSFLKNQLLKNDFHQSQPERDAQKIRVNTSKIEPPSSAHVRSPSYSPDRSAQEIEPPARAHVRSPSYSPVRSAQEAESATRIEFDGDFGFLKKDQIGQLKDEILSTRKSLSNQSKTEKSKMVKMEKLKVQPTKPPTWKNVQGRPKSASIVTGNRKPHTSKISRKSSMALERELPFTVGQNPGKSYSVTANIQKVYSLLKSHNPTICSVCSDKSCDSKCKKQALPKKNQPKASIKDDVSKHSKNEIKAPSGSSLNVLATNLSNLENEFERLKGEYNILLVKYDNALRDQSQKSSIGLREIGANLKEVIHSMETKNDQIAILKQIFHTAKNSSENPGKKASRNERPIPSRPISPSKALENLGLLKNSRIVQESLMLSNS